MSKPIRLTIAEPDFDGDLLKHRFEITVDDDGLVEIRNVDFEGIAQRGPATALTVGQEPSFTHLQLAVEVR
jgi:hypothetical protein